MKALRQYIRQVISESHFPIYGGAHARIHHSRDGSRDPETGKPQVDGFSQKPGMKPEGLWYECTDDNTVDWKEFCNTGFGDEDFYEKKYDATFNVELAENGYHILFIADEHHFDKFMKMYGVPHPVFPDDEEEMIIDWPKVASHYAGIEICPYLSKRRQTMWYYGWDVASGCIWSSKGIKELTEPC